MKLVQIGKTDGDKASKIWILQKYGSREKRGRKTEKAVSYSLLPQERMQNNAVFELNLLFVFFCLKCGLTIFRQTKLSVTWFLMTTHHQIGETVKR